MKLSDLEWFERTPEHHYGRAKDGKEYCISWKTGKLEEVPKGTIWPNWFGSYMSQVEEELAKAKEYARKEYGVAV
jgi:hypothetical protein